MESEKRVLESKVVFLEQNSNKLVNTINSYQAMRPQTNPTSDTHFPAPGTLIDSEDYQYFFDSLYQFTDEKNITLLKCQLDLFIKHFITEKYINPMADLLRRHEVQKDPREHRLLQRAISATNESAARAASQPDIGSGTSVGSKEQDPS